MSIRALTYFLVAAEELNFTKAAGKLYVTQQTLSNHIKRLEEQYDVQLFNRYPRLRLTLCECMVRYATRILRLERAMNAEFADLSQDTSGVLLVGCSRMRGKYYLPKIWSVYRRSTLILRFVCWKEIPTFCCQSFWHTNWTFALV